MKPLIRTFASENEMTAFAASLAPLGLGIVIYLSGQLGAGKTTFARGFLRGLGYAGKVKSPSYTLVEPYDLDEGRVYHFDFYRLTHAGELEEMGVRDYFEPGATCLIEWPEKGSPLLPPADLSCYIAICDAGREVRLTAHTARGERCLSNGNQNG